ncbi:hypothetical protein EDEG_02430 [Edhazardia aedis USNM 41457]|uniref:GLTSCR protein conserved domain-containing protein n=1 Tax=Edhazardia aedis (strain USNM 41457) TaxID=1003232 RepID=J9DPB1_EDHAE|nr:hypothetical protein EDEG_02430 [Edhazardia aedis USNM 41457]|eukprot:EJW03177.1 hypothetical protein EDEG_02430 [Edhazardia aedis USNM 41457]
MDKNQDSEFTSSNENQHGQMEKRNGFNGKANLKMIEDEINEEELPPHNENNKNKENNIDFAKCISNKNQVNINRNGKNNFDLSEDINIKNTHITNITNINNESFHYFQKGEIGKKIHNFDKDQNEVIPTLHSNNFIRNLDHNTNKARNNNNNQHISSVKEYTDLQNNNMKQQNNNPPKESYNSVFENINSTDQNNTIPQSTNASYVHQTTPIIFSCDSNTQQHNDYNSDFSKKDSFGYSNTNSFADNEHLNLKNASLNADKNDFEVFNKERLLDSHTLNTNSHFEATETQQNSRKHSKFETEDTFLFSSQKNLQNSLCNQQLENRNAQTYSSYNFLDQNGVINNHGNTKFSEFNNLDTTLTSSNGSQNIDFTQENISDNVKVYGPFSSYQSINIQNTTSEFNHNPAQNYKTNILYNSPNGNKHNVTQNFFGDFAQVSKKNEKLSQEKTLNHRKTSLNSQNIPQAQNRMCETRVNQTLNPDYPIQHINNFSLGNPHNAICINDKLTDKGNYTLSAEYNQQQYYGRSEQISNQIYTQKLLEPHEGDTETTDIFNLYAQNANPSENIFSAITEDTAINECPIGIKFNQIQINNHDRKKSNETNTSTKTFEQTCTHETEDMQSQSYIESISENISSHKILKKKRGRKPKPCLIPQEKNTPSRKKSSKIASNTHKSGFATPSIEEKALYFYNKETIMITNPDIRPFINKNHAIECLLPYHLCYDPIKRNVSHKDIDHNKIKNLSTQIRDICYKFVESDINEENVSVSLLQTEAVKYIYEESCSKVTNKRFNLRFKKPTFNDGKVTFGIYGSDEHCFKLKIKVDDAFLRHYKAQIKK